MGKADKIRFYNISQASLEEVRYFIFLAKDLGYIDKNIQINNLAEEISKMLDKYIKQIHQSMKTR